MDLTEADTEANEQGEQRTLNIPKRMPPPGLSLEELQKIAILQFHEGVSEIDNVALIKNWCKALQLATSGKKADLSKRLDEYVKLLSGSLEGPPAKRSKVQGVWVDYIDPVSKKLPHQPFLEADGHVYEGATIEKLVALNVAEGGKAGEFKSPVTMQIIAASREVNLHARKVINRLIDRGEVPAEHVSEFKAAKRIYELKQAEAKKAAERFEELKQCDANGELTGATSLELAIAYNRESAKENRGRVISLLEQAELLAWREHMKNPTKNVEEHEEIRVRANARLAVCRMKYSNYSTRVDLIGLGMQVASSLGFAAKAGSEYAFHFESAFLRRCGMPSAVCVRGHVFTYPLTEDERMDLAFEVDQF